MNDVERSHVDMIDVVDNVFTINNATWSVKAVFAALVTNFRALRTLIYQLMLIAGRDDEGITLQKADSRLLLTLKGNRIRRALWSYGQAANKLTIAGEVSESESELKAMNDVDFITEMTKYHVLADANAVALLDYDIIADDITAFEDAITDFRDWKADPRTAEIQRKSAAEELSKVIRDAVALLSNRVDPAMYMFENDGTSFYADYFNARIIVDPQTTTMALRGIVQDSETQAPLAGAQLHILPAGINRTTGETGRFEVINLPEGDAQINCTRPGYADLSVPAVIVHGQTTEVTLNMIAE